MTQLQKYYWLIDTIRRAGRISFSDLSDRYRRNKDMSDDNPFSRATFNRWKDDILDQFGIRIMCQRVGGYLYYIDNIEELEGNRLKNWMLNSFAVGNIISENLAIKERILVDHIPSGHDFLAPIIKAMQAGITINITYHSFRKPRGATFPIEPYCVKLFENRWYVLARNISFGDIRIYGLDRIEHVEETDRAFKLPKGFDAAEYFSRYFGIVADDLIPVERIVIRSNRMHSNYLKTLPLHHSQRLVDDCGEYADFEFRLAPTYDFIMKLLQFGPMIEVIEPTEFRHQVKGWISEMYELYSND